MEDLTTTAMTVDAARQPFGVTFGVVAQCDNPQRRTAGLASDSLLAVAGSSSKFHSIDSVNSTVADLTSVVGGGTGHRFGGSGTALTMIAPPTAHAATATAATTWAATMPAAGVAQTEQVRPQPVPAPSIKVNLGGYARGIPPRGTPV
jgi:hypothetical protein